MLMLIGAVIEGNRVPLGDNGPLSLGDQPAAAVREQSQQQGVFAGVAVNWELGLQQYSAN